MNTMSLAAGILSVVIAVLFTVLGLAKVAALEPMRERAAHVGSRILDLVNYAQARGGPVGVETEQGRA